MGKKRPSLSHQFHENLYSQLRIGESRDDAKKVYKEYCKQNNLPYINGQAEGIFSWNTYTAYKQTCEEFVKWLGDNYSEIKYIKHITREICIEYLQWRNSNGISAWTIDKDKSALNKIFNYRITKKEADLPIRSIKNIKRSREEAGMDAHFNAENYTNQILFAKASGCRRESVLRVTFNDFIFQNNVPVVVYLKEKGGRERYAPILREYQAELGEFLLSVVNKEEPIFYKYTTMIDNHAFRSEYANKLYDELMTEGVPDYVKKYTV